MEERGELKHGGSKADSGFAKARDGTKIAYELTHGEATGRVVLIHSLATNTSFWRRVVPILQRYTDVLVYDCRGHGRSGKPPGPYNVDLFADDLADLLDHVGWSSAVIAGASMGGCVAMSFATAYPDRCSGLGLIDTTDWYGPEAPRLWSERANKARAEGLGALVSFQLARWFTDTFRRDHPEEVEHAAAVFLANDLEAYSASCYMMGAVDKRAELSACKAPTAIVVGSEDYATPVELARAMSLRVRGSKLHIIDGARHFTALETPDAVAGEIAVLAGASVAEPRRPATA